MVVLYCLPRSPFLETTPFFLHCSFGVTLVSWQQLTDVKYPHPMRMSSAPGLASNHNSWAGGAHPT